MPDDTRRWTDQIFENAVEDARVAMNIRRGEMLREGAERNSRAGLVQAKAYAERISAAVETCLNGLSNQYLSRGRQWRRVHRHLLDCLTATLETGPLVIHHCLPEAGGGRALATQQLLKEGRRLRKRSSSMNSVGQFRQAKHGMSATP